MKQLTFKKFKIANLVLIEGGNFTIPMTSEDDASCVVDRCAGPTDKGKGQKPTDKGGTNLPDCITSIPIDELMNN